MTTHVFIVDSTTLKVHLEFMFAGTGAKNHRIDFNGRSTTRHTGRTENVLVAMIADASRIRKGDLVVFYLQRNQKQKIYEGKFYGIFRATADWAFLDNCNSGQYLRQRLSKSLTFRTLIEPYDVYAEGVTEWEALDEIRSIDKPEQMLWSLIYRKLKAKRGNTMITTYEAEQLCELIRRKNRSPLRCEDNVAISFDAQKQEITCSRRKRKSYRGRKEPIDIFPRLLARAQKKPSFEAHLQAYMVRNIGKLVNESLDNCVLENGRLEWIGNEVSCGVGMQRIDVLLSVLRGTRWRVIPIELKSGRPNRDTVAQMQRYVDWLSQYYVPNCRTSVQIQPVLLCKQIGKKRKVDGTLTANYERIISSFRRFNEINGRVCRKLKYVEFFFRDGNIVFEPVSY